MKLGKQIIGRDLRRKYWPLVAFFLSMSLLAGGCGFKPGSAPPLTAQSPAVATEQSLLTLGQFPEPLIPVGGTPSPAENEALAAAIGDYHRVSRETPENLTALEAFLSEHPRSPWVASLRLNCGLLYHQNGQYSKALASLRQAWAMLSTSKEPRAKAQADRTVGELAITWAYLGRYEELEPLLKEVRSRHLSGSATEMIAAAAEGLHDMQATPESSFLCGPLALEHVCRLRPNDHSAQALGIVGKLRSTKKGTSLAQLWQAADQAGLHYQIAFRQTGAPVITPAIAHWQVGHFSCLEEGKDKRFRVEDPTYGAFGDTITMAPSTLDEESSGYFLVPPGPLPKGWRNVSLAEGQKIWGRGDTGPNKDGRATTTCDAKDGKGCCGGMARWMSHTMVVGLALQDTPVGTSPSAFSIPFTINYAQREVSQPSVFTYTNFGPKWTCNWLSYITTDGYRSRANLYEMGGGLETFPFFLATGDGSKVFGPNSNTTLHRSIDANYVCTYVREFPDGSTATYDKVDTRTSQFVAGRVFMSKMTDPQGNATTIQYDDQFRIQSITSATGKVMTLAYELQQDPYKVTKVTDPYGRHADFTYSADGLLTSSTDTIGITSSFAYGPSDFINALTTPYGTTTFQYGDASTDPNLGVTRWLTATDPSGRTSRIESKPQAAGIPTSETIFPQGQQINNIYLDYRNTFVWTPEQLAGGLDYTKATVYHFQHIYPLGGETGLGQFFGGTGRTVESIKRPLERRVWYTYKGNERDGAAFEGTTSLPSVIGRVLGDGSTQLVRMDYNAQGNVISKIDPSGRSYLYQYAANGIDLTSMTVNGQQLMAATYDGSHNIQSLTSASGGTSTFAYNSRGQITSAANELNEVTTYAYTGDGNLSGVQAPLGSNTSFGHDAVGRKTSATDSEGYTVQANYDDADRPTSLTFPDGTTETMEYNRLDLVATTDRLGRHASYQFDASQRLTQVIDPKGGATDLAYSEFDQPVSVSDPGGRVTVFGYDLQSRLSVKQYSGGGTQLYSYLPCCGLPRSVTDALGRSKTFSYNVDNTLKALAYSGGTPGVTFAYDSLLPRPLSMTDGTGQTSYTYGPFGAPGANAIASVAGPYGDTATFQYDVAGRPISQTVNGSAESVTYDPLWRATQATNALDTFNMTYLGKTGQVTSVNSTTGPSASYAYAPNEGDRRLTQIKNLGRSGSALSQFDYVHDSVGQITQLTETHGTATNTSGGGEDGHCHKKCCHGNKCCKKHKCCKTKCCKGKKDCGDDDCDLDHAGGNALVAPWDLSLLRGLITLVVASAWAALLWQFVRQPRGRTSRLAQVTSLALVSCLTINGCIFGGGGTTSASAVMDFSYDQLGQLIGVNVNQTATENYTFDPSGNLTSLTVGNTTTNFSYNSLNQPTSPGTNIFDAKGQTTTKDGKTFEWDDDGRLTAVVVGTQRSEFAYDGMSRRTKITELTNGTVTSKKLYWWLGGSIVSERDGLTTGFPITKRYFGQGVLQGSTKLFYTLDHLGSVRELVDSAGVVQADYRYTTYGERSKQSGALESDFGYAGLWHHAPSGLDLATYRAYDAANRRWISRDPLGEGVDLNLYRYCGNDPIGCADPLGLKKITLLHDRSPIIDPLLGITGYLQIDAVWDTCTSKLTIKTKVINLLDSSMKVWGRMRIWSNGSWQDDKSGDKVDVDINVGPAGSLGPQQPPAVVDIPPGTVDLHLRVNLRSLHAPTPLPDGVRIYSPVPYASGTATARNPDIRNN